MVPRRLIAAQGRSKRWQRRLGRSGVWTAAVLAACGSVYALGSFIAAPLLVERAAARYAAQSPAHVADAGRVRFNPFTATLELLEVTWVEPQAGISLTAPRVTAEFGIGWLLERRLALDMLTLVQPEVALQWPAGGRAPLGVFGATRVEHLAVQNGALTLTGDPGGRDAGRPLGRGTLLIEGLDGRAPAGTRYELTFAATDGAEIRLDGQLTPPPTRARGRLQVKALDLAALAPWIDARLAAVAPTGRVDSAGDYVLAGAGEAWQLELPEAQALLHDLRFEPLPGLLVRAPRLALGAHAIMRHAEGEATAAAALRLDGARIELEDTRFGAPMSFALSDMAGVVARDDPHQPAAPGVVIELRGRLEDGGAVSFAARFPDERTPDRASVELRAAQVAATALAPAAARVLGRGLTAGRADLTLEYSRDRRTDAIDGRIAIVANALQLESAPPNAWPLALALLTDADGRAEIEAAIRATAETDAAETAALSVRERLAAVAAAPFATLGQLVGRDGFALRSVEFDPGTAELSPAGTETVGALAAALAQRPLLTLAVGGGFDPRVDRDALAAQQIELHVTLATAGAAPQARPKPVDLASPRAQDVLDEFAGERLAPERLEAIAARFAFDATWAPDAPARVAYYRAVFEALAANERIADAALERLGRFRARSIATALAELGIDPDRIAIDDSAAGLTADRQGVAVPVEIGARAIAPPH